MKRRVKDWMRRRGDARARRKGLKMQRALINFARWQRRDAMHQLIATVFRAEHFNSLGAKVRLRQQPDVATLQAIVDDIAGRV